MISNKIGDKITIPKSQSNPGSSCQTKEKKINGTTKKRYISPEKRQLGLMSILKKQLVSSTPNELSKLRTRNWVYINDEAWRTCNNNLQIKFKTTMLKSSLS